ncbi:MAG: endonuclease/exonuclease/phosphatase family protein [Flavobacterium sp.]|nr:endonuclease/exonuclease/phosphatase family protein [Flavobacterium sp.]
MKLITWNCNMAFRKKAEPILAYYPDIIVVPECENPEKLIFDKDHLIPRDSVWYGTNPNKGLGVFSYAEYKLKLLDCHNPDFKNILPIAVSGGKIDFILFAIWANNPEDKDGQYITQIWKAFHFYESLLTENSAIFIGDFNSNSIWDKPRREGNHSTLVTKLASKNIESVYHKFHQQEQGKENHPTLFMYRHHDKPYHLDYCFVSEDFIEKLEHVEVGSYEDWCQYSDHCPLLVHFNL